MSVEAMVWVLNDAPDLPSRLLPTLIALANSADHDGRNAWPSQTSIAERARKSVRQVHSDLAELAKLGLVREGDQRVCSHIRSDRRPVVYDLALEKTKANVDGPTVAPPSGQVRALRQARSRPVAKPVSVPPVPDSPVEKPARTPRPKPATPGPVVAPVLVALDGMPVPPPRPAAETTVPQQLVAGWIDSLAARPPSQVIGQVSRQVKTLVADGIDPAQIARGLLRWQAKGLHPNVLPSVVHEVMNAPAGGQPGNGQPANGRYDRVAAARSSHTPEAWL